MPRVAISVDMLDTGIDVRELVNLVFAKPVYSYTKFWQMIGRGIRLLEPEKIKPWCTGKDTFLILDCWDNFEYFKLNPKGNELRPQVPLPLRLFGIRLQKIEEAQMQGKTDIVQKEVEKIRKQVAALPKNSVVILDAKHELQRLEEDNFWNSISAPSGRLGAAMEFLDAVVKPVFRTVADVDYKAMRFEKDIVEASLANLVEETEKFETLKDNIMEEIGELPLGVNIVAKEEPLIKQAQSNHFWATITEEKLVHKNGYLQQLIFKNGKSVIIKAIYTRKPFIQHCSISELLDCELNNDSYIKVDPAQKPMFMECLPVVTILPVCVLFLIRWLWVQLQE